MNMNDEIKAMEEASSTEKKHVSFVKQSPKKNIIEDGVKERKDKRKNKNEGVHELALKMKELDMNDSSDVEQVLDIEEALHYYSRLKSPVYLDIVDKFFTDIHSEFSVSQSSVSINRSKSKGRFGSIRL
ncbi:ATP-dependent RNA helicase DDX11-like protein [Trifolium pratense]|uniref:ATP-dependent RNA helicase DDX11-like protein n=1 Tax=Trifolium pratense TaxID=57577 RepID=A0A2K3NN76_TRIPR|nr:uncharacterized protein LOC123898112 [Trifolium pratense]PNY04491.1 ATP-dependent RNA helicase DDX11-like protein [Trifolium pratense]PNY12290.1 ATP-dependent RNA helicase DDX11-like protein [Trifolium pratense]PNY12313.1 ATP-dependent RNA helicase DDX11-like protein [Trifolium pratense]